MILDLRSWREVRDSPIDGAIPLNIPLPPLSPQQIEEMAVKIYGAVDGLLFDAEIHVLCAKGKRSALGAAILKQAGFINVVDLGGVD